MNTTHLRLAAAAAAVAITFVAGSASAHTFMNGQSTYGEPAAAGSNARVVDVSSVSRLRATYGETLTFRSESGQLFTWTFNGLGQRAVSLAHFAPSGFTAKDVTIYIGKNPSNRG